MVNPLYMKINKEQKENGDQGCGIIAVDLWSFYFNSDRLFVEKEKKIALIFLQNGSRGLRT